MFINSFQNDKTIDWPNFKAFAEDNSDVAKMAKLVFDRVENIAGNGEYSIFCFTCNVFKNLLSQGPLTVSQTIPGFYMSAVQVF